MKSPVSNLQEHVMNYLSSQFGNPRGFIGHLVGLIMAYENRARNQWALSLLDIQPTDNILEIGFGPGWAIQHAGKLASHGLVAGIDRSMTMVKQATVRNRVHIQSGRVVLRHGPAAQIPFDNGMFNKVYAVNSFHEWDDLVGGLQEVRRVLVPGGLLVIVEHLHGVMREEDIQVMQGDLKELFGRLGLRDIKHMFNHLQGRPALAVRGVRS